MINFKKIWSTLIPKLISRSTSEKIWFGGEAEFSE